MAVDEPPQHGTLSLAADGGFVYTPDRRFSGADRFTYVATALLSDQVQFTAEPTEVWLDVE